jgi:hypothetical protein
MYHRAMALFPKCSFQVLLSGGVFVPGSRVDGTLVVTAQEPIPRADHIELAFRTNAWAGYGSGKNRRVVRRTVFNAPFRVDVPNELLPAGTHRFPFAVDVPAWLPPGYRGADCAIEHEIETRLDVDWAIDPKATVYPVIYPAPQQGQRTTLNTRSPLGFHETIVLEVTLASSVLAIDEPLLGQIALRSGHAARFDAIELSFASVARITMGRGDGRYGPQASKIRIPAQALRSGEAVPFQIPSHPLFLPSFRTSFIDHDLVLAVSVDIPWALDAAFDIPLLVLPRGSTIHGDAAASVVGSERLQRLAAAMAQSTGLREGRAPVLVEGAVGPVGLRIADAPREARLGIDVDLTFPDVELGIAFRPLGMLEGFRESPLLPAALANRYLLRCTNEDATVSSFLNTVLDDLAQADEIRFSDHHLGLHFPLPNDEPERMVAIARAAHARAKAIGDAVTRLPFPAAILAAQPAWQATAAEQNAFLVPTGPSLHGLSFRARVLGGEERAIGATIRTVWTKEGPVNHIDVDLRAAPLSEAACAELESESPTDRAQALRAAFPEAHVHAQGRGATLERADWSADPRALLPAIETFFWWLLEVRGERRADAPYR